MRLKERIVCIVMIFVMTIGLMPANPAYAKRSDEKAVMVNYSSQSAGGFLHAPKYGAIVYGNLAERYGYADAVSPTEGVSALDVLVMATIDVLGEDRFAAATGECLTVNESGYITKIFVENSVIR